MHIVRRISQTVSFMLFAVLFFAASYPLVSMIPVDSFLQLDPLLGISAAIAGRSLYLKFIPGLILLVLTVLFGRFFCGWICPLGVCLDMAGMKSSSRERDNRKYRYLKYSLLFALLTGAFFSVQLTGFLDPLSLLTRTWTTVLYPLFVLGAEAFLGIFMAVPFLEEVAFSLHDALRGSILPISALMFRSSVVIALIFTAVMALSKLNKRFWCRYICPLGALYALFSRVRFYRRRVSDACTECGICTRSCRMNAISTDGRLTDSSECINCMGCISVCPQNAVSFSFGSRTADVPVDVNRRRVFSAAAAGLITAGMLQTGQTRAQDRGRVVRPPGSCEEDLFLDKCIRCGECIRVCSTAGGGLQYALSEGGFAALWTPILIPETGYCEYNCTMCGDVCPTGAIHQLLLEERQEMKMGTAHFNKSVCIPWYYGENCMVCEEHCPLPDKAIRFRESDTTTIDGRESTVLLPYVVEEDCIGCGICVNKCPLEGERGLFLTNADEIRWF